MKQTAVRYFTFLRCYHTLIIWGLYAGLVLMTFFRLHLPGERWIWISWLGVAGYFFSMTKLKSHQSIPRKYLKLLVVILICSILFSLFDSFFTISGWANGRPRLMEGSYVLIYKGSVKNSLTEQEYHFLKCLEQQNEAAHMLVFWAIFSIFRCERKKDER